MTNGHHVRVDNRGSAIEDYWPLLCLVIVTALGALALSAGFGDLTLRGLMHGYMGLFLLIFSLLKLFDLEGFKDGFAMYDLLARRVPFYGYVYPFLELALALAYLAFAVPTATYAATIALFGFGALGVVSALRRGLDIDCPCMGNVLAVPLSTVTLTEDAAMVAMALVLLAMA
ncbi:MauE/DoxX family redox-associated membrane protein [Polymorphum gilvum]|uniref:Methylamine utilization protein MauE n=1 Tax=Polymorphum gilvum (strain LMG 25793 / CGMCC 1.9160 / SL003B-26A1) TaxID=991905 RepID=F2IYG1_POLGS|nr:MauE/DoxX family redox-associated membrane protein [Polymorphum gilvum]ADZ68474.1 Conserved hypothetical membrane protein [Polymorphum gilvum SL003B-26A1]